MILQATDFPWLSALLLILIAAAILVVFLPEKKARYIALASNLVALFTSILILIGFNNDLSGFQYTEKYNWISTLNIHYQLGVDGLSILFLPATTLLFSFVTLSSWNNIQTLKRGYYALLLLLEFSILGVFTALDTINFLLFWELTLIPLFFLLSLWGVGANRRYASVKYVLFMLTGGLPILIAFVLLAVQEDKSLIFDYTELLKVTYSEEKQLIIFLLLLFGFGIKTPLFPLHTWLPVVTIEGHASTVATIVGLKLGAYGLLRFTLPLTPDAAHQFQWLLLGLGTVSVIYGAIAALAQTNIRKMLAYSSLSHVGLVILGMATFNLQGIQGAVFQLLNFTLFSSGLFLLSGFIFQRIGSTDVISLGGIAKTMPLLSSFFFFLGLANMGVPGTSSFPAEFLIILGSFKHHPGVGIAILFSIVLGAAYFLSIYRKSFFGEATNQAVIDAVDLKPRELLIVAIISGIIIVIGLYPQFVLNIIEGSAQSWVNALKISR